MHVLKRTWAKIQQIFLVTVLLCAALLPAGAGHAEESLLFLLDCSGSMWGRVEQQPKIVVAKKVLAQLLKDVPPGVQVGLMAYGHRKKGDCSDIEMVYAPGRVDATLLEGIARLNALGRTPISDALLLAGEQLSGRENSTTIVLISDGLETCGGDPCAVAAKLKQQGLKLVIHVVGFDVSEQQASQLHCIAENTGGRFFRADNLDQLQKVLLQVKTATVENKPLPQPPPPPEVKTLADTTSSSTTLHIAGPGTVVLKAAPWVTMPPRSWALTDVETGAVKASGNGTQLRVPAGQYQILWQQSEHNHDAVQLTSIIEVESGKTVEAPLETGLRLTLPRGVDPPYQWGLMLPDGETAFWKTTETGTGQLLPAGVYRLYWQQTQHGSLPQVLTTIELKEGQLNDVVLETGLILQAADWLSPAPYDIRLQDSRGKTVAGWNTYGPHLAPPGTYTLIYRPSQHHNNDIVWGQVTLTGKEFLEVPLNSGIQFTHDPGARPPYRIILVNKDTGAEILAQETWAPLPAPPGRYRLDWWEEQHGTTRQTLAEEFTLNPGVLVNIDM